MKSFELFFEDTADILNTLTAKIHNSLFNIFSIVIPKITYRTVTDKSGRVRRYLEDASSGDHGYISKVWAIGPNGSKISSLKNFIISIEIDWEHTELENLKHQSPVRYNHLYNTIKTFLENINVNKEKIYTRNNVLICKIIDLKKVFTKYSTDVEVITSLF